MTTSKCRAKDPTNCAYHGTSTTKTNMPVNTTKVEFEQLTPLEISQKLERKLDPNAYLSEAPVLPPMKKPFSGQKVQTPVTKKALEKSTPLEFLEYVSKQDEKNIQWPLRRKIDFRGESYSSMYTTQSILAAKKVPHQLISYGLDLEPMIEVYPANKNHVKIIAQLEMQRLTNAVRLDARIKDRKIKQPIKDLLKRVPKPTPNSDEIEKRVEILKTKAARYGVKLF